MMIHKLELESVCRFVSWPDYAPPDLRQPDLGSVSNLLVFSVGFVDDLGSGGKLLTLAGRTCVSHEIERFSSAQTRSLSRFSAVTDYRDQHWCIDRTFLTLYPESNSRLVR